MMELHKRLRTLRKDQGITQQEVARRCGVSCTWISAFENGHKQISDGLAIRYGQVLGLSAEETLDQGPGFEDDALTVRLIAMIRQMDRKEKETLLRLADVIRQHDGNDTE